ncbi:hypothetical protein D3C75_707940 [compost metagenome]
MGFDICNDMVYKGGQLLPVPIPRYKHKSVFGHFQEDVFNVILQVSVNVVGNNRIDHGKRIVLQLILELVIFVNLNNDYSYSFLKQLKTVDFNLLVYFLTSMKSVQ